MSRSEARERRRALQGRLLAGVCVIVSIQFGIDVTLVRLAFLVSSLFWGIGILLYLILWAVLIEGEIESAASFKRSMIRRADAFRKDASDMSRYLAAWRQQEHQPWPRPLNRQWIAIILLVFGVGILLASLGALSWLTPTRALGLGMVLFGGAILVTLRSPQ